MTLPDGMLCLIGCMVCKNLEIVRSQLHFFPFQPKDLGTSEIAKVSKDAKIF